MARQTKTSKFQMEILQQYQQGVSPARIAGPLGLSVETVRCVLKRAGVELRHGSTGHRKFELTAEEKAQLVQMYADGAAVQVIADAFGISWRGVRVCLQDEGVELRAPGFRKGEAHHAWVGGRHSGEDGYVRVWLSADDPLVSMAQQHGDCDGGYALEHRVVLARKLGRPLNNDETVHHVDGIRHHNNPSNLQLRQGKHGKGHVFRCRCCGSYDVVAEKLEEPS